MSIVEFLLARIAEDEARARKVQSDPWFAWGVGHVDDCDFPGDMTGECSCGAAGRVLAECEAKRQVVEDATNQHTSCRELTWVVQVLAAVYYGHPDYDEAWRP